MVPELKKPSPLRSDTVMVPALEMVPPELLRVGLPLNISSEPF